MQVYSGALDFRKHNYMMRTCGDMLFIGVHYALGILCEFVCGCGRVGGGYTWVCGYVHAWVWVGEQRGHMFQVVACEFQTVRK